TGSLIKRGETGQEDGIAGIGGELLLERSECVRLGRRGKELEALLSLGFSRKIVRAFKGTFERAARGEFFPEHVVSHRKVEGNFGGFGKLVGAFLQEAERPRVFATFKKDPTKGVRDEWIEWLQIASRSGHRI